MTIQYHILVGENLNSTQWNQVNQIVADTFAEVDQIYNKWNPNSELSQLNRMKAGETTPLSPKLEKLLILTKHVFELTEGRFDPTIEPLQQLWKQKLAQNQIPTDSEIQNIIPAIGWEKIHLQNGKFSKDHDATSLDLGGIAKGFCVDLLIERLCSAGYPNLFVEWGGEIRTSGEHPEHRPWRVFISRLGNTEPENAIAFVDLRDQAIATSGDYLQNWTVGTTTYYHIIDPKTHRPLIATSDSIASASVLASTCALADGLATAAMMFPTLAEAQIWISQMQEQYPDTQFWLLTR